MPQPLLIQNLKRLDREDTMSTIVDLYKIVGKDVKDTDEIIKKIKEYQEAHPDHVVRVGLKFDEKGKLQIVPIQELERYTSF